MAYLYGASIQGIQGFIFETNKLKEIVGASNLIEKFTSEDFLNGFLQENNILECKYNILRNAGGNIRLSFKEEQKDILEVFVKEFPKYIMQKAYGITISQAVEKYEDNSYLDATKALEILLKDTRNKVPLVLDAKFALMSQAPRTGKPHHKNISHRDKETQKDTIEHYDKGSYQKYINVDKANKDLLLEKMYIPEDEHKKFPLELSSISNNKNKIAVIHADGNKMGLLLQMMAENLKGKADKEIQKIFKDFSVGIENATKKALKTAFDAYFSIDTNSVPFRPIIIGGDDVTVICHADSAIDFISLYMEEFQTNTKSFLGEIIDACLESSQENIEKLSKFKAGLTACAGIAYCNEKFPFHYAVNLAEVLCGRAKSASNREASCLLFHNIQGSAFVDYKHYVQNELTIDNKATKIHLEYGPYYIEDTQSPYIGNFNKLYDAMTKKSFPVGKLREWLSELHYSYDYAQSYLERVRVMAERNSSENEFATLETALKDMGGFSLNKLIDDNNKTPIHDILQLKSVQGGGNV